MDNNDDQEKKKEKSQLERVVISRTSDGFWNVIRMRKDNGETIGRVRNLQDAFDAVLSAYEVDGTAKEVIF
jgi:hypothetical protein